MKKIYLLITFFLIVLFPQAQTTFQLQIGNDNSTSLNNIAIATNGDLIVCGGGYTLITRIDSNGKVKWTKNFTDMFGKITKTSDNGFAIFSYTQPYKDLLIKCDSNGNVQWSKQIISSSLSFDAYNSICQTKEGNYYLSDGDYYHNIQVIKIDSNGNLLWNKAFSKYNINFSFSPISLTDLKNDDVLLTAADPGCEFYCFYLDLIKFDAIGNYKAYSLYTGNYESPEPLLITDKLNNTQGLFKIDDGKSYRYAYMTLNFNETNVKCILFPYDILSVQQFVKNNQLKEIVNKPLNENLYYSFLIKPDWSLTEASSYDHSSIQLKKYDSLGRICPDYTIPQVKKHFESTEFSIYPFTTIPVVNSISIKDTLIESIDEKIDSMICFGEAVNSNFATTSINESKNADIKNALYPNPATKFVTINYVNDKNQSAEILFYTTTGVLEKQSFEILQAGKNSITLNIQALNSGIHFIKIQTKSTQQIFQLLKQ